MVEQQAKVADVVSADPGVEAVSFERGRRLWRHAGNQGRLFVRLKDRTRPDGRSRTDHRDAAAQTGRHSRHPHLFAEPAAGAHRRIRQPQPLSVHAASPRYGRTLPRADDFEKRMRPVPGLRM